MELALSRALQAAAERSGEPLARAILHLGFVGLLLGLPLAQTVRRQAALRRVEAERARVQAELQMLQAQIEPHFLFNTLATLRSLVRQQSTLALPLLDHMTGFLEAVLPQLREPQSSLGRELKILTEYLSIMSLRLQPRLRYRIEVPESLLQTPLPPLLLQPLVENAVLHGIEACEQGGELTLSASREGPNLLLRVFNTGAPLQPADTARSAPQQGQGLALNNLRQRLQALYGGAAQFQLTAVEGGTEACLRLPCATPP
jgi:LytS/YehU family sensor histidine kinase